MWTPVFNDPASCGGSLDTVPATRSVHIRGLNNSTPAAVSAQVVISSIFDKKRSQLCAVWVTTNVPSSPFQLLNTAIRKYDSLRGKYIAAYLEALHLCNRRPEVETFMKWMYSCKRDLPSYFQASAMNGGSRPSNSQTQDPLLVTDNKKVLQSQGLLLSSKRKANDFLADILIHEMSEKFATKSASSSAESRKTAESYLKHSYACYLRLNCKTDDLKKIRAFRYGAESIPEVEALCQAYLLIGDTRKELPSDAADFGDWSGGGRKSHIFKKSLLRCKELFPSLSGNFFSKKGPGKSKNDDDEGEAGNKRKRSAAGSESGSTKVSFEVAVPEGLKAGDTFMTSVKVAGSDQPSMKVKLTVPSGAPSTLRFNLDVPMNNTNKSKKAKVKS